jgi:nucleotide-binding universal stress UspA family protein
VPGPVNSAPILNPLGLLLAIVFALLMAGLLLWMFKVPAPLPQAVAHARRSVSGIRRILVPTRGDEHDERAVELACRLGQEQKSQIILTYVLEIPLTLSLGTPLPEEEQKATKAMERSIEIVKVHNLEAVTLVERDREVGRGILRTARDLGVDMVVIGMNPARSHFADPLGRTTETLLRQASFEVVVDKHPSTQTV